MLALWLSLLLAADGDAELLEELRWSGDPNPKVVHEDCKRAGAEVIRISGTTMMGSGRDAYELLGIRLAGDWLLIANRFGGKPWAVTCRRGGQIALSSGRGRVPMVIGETGLDVEASLVERLRPGSDEPQETLRILEGLSFQREARIGNSAM